MSSEKDLTDINFFICSTYVDLKVYREAVIKNLQSHAGVINSQEFFGARTQEPLQTCLEELERSNVFVMFLGPRYGSIDKESGQSFVECEYKRASELKLPRFVYIMDPSHSFPIKHVSIGEEAEKLDEFKRCVQTELTVDYFTTPEDLTAKVYADLVRELPKQGFKIGNADDPEEPVSTSALLQKFLSLPKLFHGRTSSFKATLGECERATERECEAFAYDYGATIVRSFKPTDRKLRNRLEYKLDKLYASSQDALSLMDISCSEEVLVTAKTIQGSYTTKQPIYGDEDPYRAIGLLRGKVIVDYEIESHLLCGLEMVEVSRIWAMESDA